MKRILIGILSLALCLALLAGCARQESARESFEKGTAGQSSQTEEGGDAPLIEEGDPIPEGMEEGIGADGRGEEEEQFEQYAARYITGVSLHRMEDFESSADIPADQLVFFFMTANYDGEDKMPIPEGYRSNTDGELLLPGADVEDYILSMFEGIDENDIRESSFYNKDKEVYVLSGFGITASGSRVEVTAAETKGDEVELVFDVYAAVPDSEGETVLVGPTATRRACFRDKGDRFAILSLETLYTGDMDKLMEEAGLL